MVCCARLYGVVHDHIRMHARSYKYVVRTHFSDVRGQWIVCIYIFRALHDGLCKPYAICSVILKTYAYSHWCHVDVKLPCVRWKSFGTWFGVFRSARYIVWTMTCIELAYDCFYSCIHLEVPAVDIDVIIDSLIPIESLLLQLLSSAACAFLLVLLTVRVCCVLCVVNIACR